MAEEPVTVPRGRHAPPLEVRREVQLQRLFQAASKVFSEVGYAEASAEAISKEAGMSKATFYEHFANKEDCPPPLAGGGGRGEPRRRGGRGEQRRAAVRGARSRAG